MFIIPILLLSKLRLSEVMSLTEGPVFPESPMGVVLILQMWRLRLQLGKCFT